ncbi:MAG: DNA mismatch repair endonuclease MutL [Chloroflexi bacterium]|nr:DNA mismatch repair endonuclease MutL [Chloroflexota bacterium]
MIEPAPSGVPGPPRIRVLPPEIAERIAAGEVVERPVSVVKELIDNSLDAGAADIRIDIEGGGLTLIRVADDGHGIAPDQLELAFQRHATSKIDDVRDLLEIATLGFRGEALPSIAAVAEVDVASSVDDDGRAVTVGIRAGKVQRRGTRGRPRGTTVWVRNLFQPIPARLKFTRNPRVESSAISQLVRRYALARPEVRFALTLDSHASLKTSGSGRLETTLAEVLGPEVAACLLPLPERTVGAGRLTGYVSAPGLSRPNRQSCIVFVNRRWVAVPVLQQALEAAYRPLLPPGRHPIVVLYVEVPPGAVDVNVHPSKAEVKLLWEADLAAAVSDAVKDVIGRSPRRPDDEQDFALAATQYKLPTPSRRGTLAAERGPGLWELDAATPTLGLKLIGQHGNTVLLAEGRGGLYVVDQHRAHERIIYEQLSARYAAQVALDAEDGGADAGAAANAQYLLEPIVMEMPPGRAEIIGDRLAALEALGFSCERFGGHSFLIRSTPDVPDATQRATLEEVLEEASDQRDDWRERLLIRLACRSAIRRGRQLTLPEATRLLDQLSRAATPAVCPHGAPIVLHFGRKFLERQFAW